MQTWDTSPGRENPPANITVATGTLACPNIPILACASWQQPSVQNCSPRLPGLNLSTAKQLTVKFKTSHYYDYFRSRLVALRTWGSSPLSRSSRASAPNLRLVVENHVQQGTVDFNVAVVINKTKFPKFVHEETHAGLISHIVLLL